MAPKDNNLIEIELVTQPEVTNFEVKDFSHDVPLRYNLNSVFYASNDVAVVQNLKKVQELGEIPGNACLLIGTGMLFSLLLLIEDMDICMVDCNPAVTEYNILTINAVLNSETIESYYYNLRTSIKDHKIEPILYSLESERKELGNFHYLSNEETYTKAREKLILLRDRIKFYSVDLHDSRGMFKLASTLRSKGLRIGLANLTNVYQYAYVPLYIRLLNCLPIERNAIVLYSSAETKSEWSLRINYKWTSASRTRSRLALGLLKYFEQSKFEEAVGDA